MFPWRNSLHFSFILYEIWQLLLLLLCEFRASKQTLCDSQFYCTHFYGPCNINREFLMWMRIVCASFHRTMYIFQQLFIFNAFPFGQTHASHTLSVRHTLSIHLYLMPLFVYHCLFKMYCNYLFAIQISVFCIANRIASHRSAWNRIILFVHPSIFCTQRYNPSFQNHLLFVAATAAAAATTNI